MRELEFDGIVIGSGPNGLTTAGYLSKAGLKVAVLERRYEAGGGLATENLTLPGLLIDSHAIYHMMVEYAPPLKDFELDKIYDLEWIYPDPQIVMPFLDGTHLALYQDIQRSYESIAKFSQKDADAFLDFAKWSQECMDLFLAPASYVNPMPSLEQAAKLHANPITRRDDELTQYTPKEIIDNMFENDRVRTLFLYLATMWGLDYDLEGLGYLVPLMINRAWNFRLCKGGSHHMCHLLAKYISRNGSRVITGAMIERIIVENGEAKGVVLEDGTIIRAKKFVCSSINPHQTFLDLVGEEHLEEELVGRLNQWQYSDTSFFTVHTALFDPPKFTVAENNPELANALMYVVGYECEQDLVDHFEASRRGELHRGGFNCCFPSLHDPVRVMRHPSSEVKHIGLISMECAPYKLKDGGPQAWNRVRRDYAEQCKATLAKYAPNMTADNVAWDYIGTPLDTENKFPDMKNGCFKQGAYLPLQMGYFRPNEYCSEHDTPIKGLYLGGASTHSGGMVTYGPGYNVANKIAEDLGIDKWWPEPDHVKRAKAANLL
ncbi:MAG: NAD(P)/FAD-dependent oxidoreductase [Deferrisomatales bacterium]|nr:NAD(P)/FAD-dependent oxidoreductase [Deferrisomatales bacterium]